MTWRREGTRPLDEFMQELQNRRESSMNYFIDVAASAQRDLADAFDYIDLNLKNPSAADKLVAIAWKKFRSLDTFPQRFSLVNDPFLSALGIRLIPVQNYLAFYKVDSSTQTVHILRFLYGHSDWQAILRADVLQPEHSPRPFAGRILCSHLQFNEVCALVKHFCPEAAHFACAEAGFVLFYAYLQWLGGMYHAPRRHRKSKRRGCFCAALCRRMPR